MLHCGCGARITGSQMRHAVSMLYAITPNKKKKFILTEINTVFVLPDRKLVLASQYLCKKTDIKACCCAEV